MTESWDVIVVGSGNAGFCAALSARELVPRVLLLEKAPEQWVGGNSYFSAGAMRTTFAGLDALISLLHEPDRPRLDKTELSAYSPETFLADMRRVTQGRCDPDLTQVLVDDSADGTAWLRAKGQHFRLMYDRQSFEIEGRWRFWGGLVLGTVDGGKGLIREHQVAAAATGIELRTSTPVTGLLRDGAGAVNGVRASGRELQAGAVVLAAGGFEADARLRAAYLGSNWDVAKVRGTPHNTGELLMTAVGEGAQAYGHWSGCHAVAWDAGAPSFGDLKITNLFTKQSYPIGLVVNIEGKRFVDEGADYRNYTYAKYGAEILRQPNAVAYQLFDAQTSPLLRQDEYTAPGVLRHEARSIRGLAESIGIPPDALEHTVSEFNASVSADPFNPTLKDGKHTNGITPPKSNWAMPLAKPPFLAFAVTCGITFTFGGLRIDTHGRVLDGKGEPIVGLHAAGEIVGGLFFHNYPGGSGLTAGTVFGRRAGRSAAACAR